MEIGSYRDTWVEISLDAIKQNVASFKQHTGQNVRMMAVVKADGYGHGAVDVAKAALDAGADYLAVAFLDEALVLRNNGIDAPILILGYTPPRSIAAAVSEEITMTVFTHDMLDAAEAASKSYGKPARIHLKINSGMNRIGISTKKEAYELAKRAADSPYIVLEGIFTHFADADNEDPSYTNLQYQSFQSVLGHLAEHGITIPIKHCCNSAATIAYPDMHLDMVRVGISLYGLYPAPHFKEYEVNLQPAMTFKTKIAAVNQLDQNEPISYGRTYYTENPSVIAALPVGYADGLSRLLSNTGEVTIKGKRHPIVGRVCMDQVMIDVTPGNGVPEAPADNINSVGTEVTIFGDPAKGCVGLDEVAARMNAISYEVACLIGKRVPRVYVGKNRENESTADYMLEHA